MSLSGTESAIPASGGTGTVTVSTQPECGWTASADSAWIAGLTPTQGQGNGQVQFQVASNPNATARESAVAVNGQRAPVRQDAAACQLSASVSPDSFPSSGGNGTITIAAPGGCAWRAADAPGWVNLSVAAGSGSASVGITVASNAGPARTGQITLGTATITIAQAGAAVPSPCTFSISPTSQSVAAAGATGLTVGITTTAVCTWTTTSHAPWLTIASDASGTGSGTVRFNVAANSGGARTGTATVGGQTFTVNQAAAAPACTYGINPTSITVGGESVAGLSVAVSASTGCSWTATSNVGWVQITAGASGSGNGSVVYRVSDFSGNSRNGTMTIAGQTFTITQVRCSATLNPQTQAVPALGGTFSVSVTTPAGCPWQAIESLNWVSITGSNSGTGSGTVTYRVDVNLGAARNGNIAIAGGTLTVTQAAVAP